MLKSIKKTNLLMMSSIILFMAFITIYLFRNCDFNDVIYEIETLPYFTKVSAMIALIALQIFLAFLPGEPLELASGYIFGSFQGTIVCLIGSMIGTIIVYYLARIFQHSIIDKMFDQSKVAEVKNYFLLKKVSFGYLLFF